MGKGIERIDSYIVKSSLYLFCPNFHVRRVGHTHHIIKSAYCKTIAVRVKKIKNMCHLFPFKRVVIMFTSYFSIFDLLVLVVQFLQMMEGLLWSRWHLYSYLLINYILLSYTFLRSFPCFCSFWNFD